MDILDVKEFIKDSCEYIVTFIVIFLVVVFVFGISRVVGDSMNNTLSNRDLVVTSNSHYRLFDIKRGDVVSFHTNEVIMIKRVIGLPGDNVKIENGTILVNDQKITDENFVPDRSYTEVFLRVPKEHVFVLGDNMANSLDSRDFGFIPKQNIEAKVMFRIFPFHRSNKV